MSRSLSGDLVQETNASGYVLRAARQFYAVASLTFTRHDNSKVEINSCIDDCAGTMPSPTITTVLPHGNDLKKRATIAANENNDAPDAAEHYLQEMKRYQNNDGDDEYIMTITDTDWLMGNPTGVTTSSNRDTTVTLLLFTSTTLMWYDPDANFDQSTVVSAKFPTLTTITTTRDEPNFSEEETSSPTTESEPELESETDTNVFTTVLQTTTTSDDITTFSSSDTGITAATETSQSDPDSNGSDLSQGGIIGISVGISVFSIAAAMLMLILFRRHHKKTKYGVSPGGSPAARDPPKMEEAHPAQQPYYQPPLHHAAQSFTSHAATEHRPVDQDTIHHAPPAAAEMEHNNYAPREQAVYQQHAAPRQYQAYHPSYTQNPRTSQGFIAELPAETHNH